MKFRNYQYLLLLALLMQSFSSFSQVGKQKGLLWQITGNGLKKPSYVYGTMHVSQKIAFHLGDSFYLALAACDVVALEQDLDSVIHRWISESDYESPEDANKVFPRSLYDFIGLNDFRLNSYDKMLIKRKLSREVSEVNYLLQRGDDDDFEEDAWLDLYIYQLAKKLGKGFTGVEGYEESRELVNKSRKEPKNAEKKKPRRNSYKLRSQVADAYRKGDIYMIDSIDRMTESEHYLEYMLYKRNANMVRRMDSIMHLGKTLFTGVGCAHLPGTKGVLQMLVEKGYKVRPVQSIALEKSKMADKYEQKFVKHKYSSQSSEDGIFSAELPTRLTRVNNNSYYSSYLSPDLANDQYYQIEKITCNSVFSGKTTDEILLVIDTLIFENIPGDIQSKNNITSNGFKGMEIVTQLKTGDLNRFRILVSPFNVYIIRMSGKKEFATSKIADKFFSTLSISEGGKGEWRTINSPDSLFSLKLPVNDNSSKLPPNSEIDPSFEHLVFDKKSGNSYLIKQNDILNLRYLEHDTFELNVMARSFATTDNFKILSSKHFDWNGYHALDVRYKNKSEENMIARFVICGTRYIMFLMKPGTGEGNFSDPFFASIQFNKKPTYQYSEYQDTLLHFTVMSPVPGKYPKEMNSYYSFYGSTDSDDEDSLTKLYKSSSNEVYFFPGNSNEFITVRAYKYGYYENISTTKKEYDESWEEMASLKMLSKKKRVKDGIEYTIYDYTDTNTNRKIITLHTLHGRTSYFVRAFVDTVSGNPEFVNKFISTFDVSDTLISGDPFKSKADRFFADFTSNDSARRKLSIKFYSEIEFKREHIKDMCRMIDTISMAGDAAKLRSRLLTRLSSIDSAQDQIIPYLQKLYTRFADTAFMQIDILMAMAKQKSLNAFQAIKPILNTDIPISDNNYDMREMLYSFTDSLKLTKLILPELIELTGLSEYRKTAYDILSTMKDSGIINESDYASIHTKLINETKIEYKRLMASLTKLKSSYDYDYYDYYDYDYNIGSDASEEIQSWPMDYSGYDYDYSYSSSSGILENILDLTLPLRSKSKDMEELVGKILKITDNDSRLELMPVLHKYKIKFDDSVYSSLAKNMKTRLKLYDILEEDKMMNLFPDSLKNHQSYLDALVKSELRRKQELDTMIFIEKRMMKLGLSSGWIYVYKLKIKDEDEDYLYFSPLMNQDTAKLYAVDEPKNSGRSYYGRFNVNSGNKIEISEDFPEEQILSNYFFILVLKATRENNGGWFSSYSSFGGRSNYYDYDY